MELKSPDFIFPIQLESYKELLGVEEKKMKSRTDPSVINYILRFKRVEVANCEAISLSKLFEKELNDWNARMKEVERKEEKENQTQIEKLNDRR